MYFPNSFLCPKQSKTPTPRHERDPCLFQAGNGEDNSSRGHVPCFMDQLGKGGFPRLQMVKPITPEIISGGGSPSKIVFFSQFVCAI